MKRNFVIICFALVAFLFSFATMANATMGTRVCTVVKAGVDSNGDVVIYLDVVSDGVNRVKHFIAPATDGNRMLAVAMTAMTSGGMTVEATMDWAIPGSELTDLMLLGN